MIPYPRNDINYDIVTPVYVNNSTAEQNSRYSIYRQLTNFDFSALEIKLINKISKNKTYKGYYHTTKEKETLYSIAKKYYDNESLWWVIAKANNYKDNKLCVIDKGTTIVIPSFSELTADNGYFNL